MKNYDIIGDIHGYAHNLEIMLLKLGYSVNPHGYYSHDSRTAIFLGDFIDRYKGGQKAVIEIVRPMIENGSALAVMGNHEFNAISYHTYHPDTNEPLRSHSSGHIDQHQAFLDEYEYEYEHDEDELRDVINWFKTLPLFLELDEIRIVHACWNDGAINSIIDELDSASVHPREVVKRALELNANAVIISHNHPSGNTEPSRADVNITDRLKSALELVDIKILDHIIVGKDCTSFAERGLI